MADLISSPRFPQYHRNEFLSILKFVERTHDLGFVAPSRKNPYFIVYNIQSIFQCRLIFISVEDSFEYIFDINGYRALLFWKKGKPKPKVKAFASRIMKMLRNMEKNRYISDIMMS